MKSMEWMKLHTELRTDPKIQALSDAQHRTWLNLLCFASDRPTRGVISGVSLGVLAFEVARGRLAVLTKTLERLQFFGIIALSDEGAITFCDFDERQYTKPSDTPEAMAERKRRSRAIQAQAQNSKLSIVDCASAPVSRDVTPCHAIETESETEKESEEETETTDKDNTFIDDDEDEANVVVPDVVSSLREFGVTDSVALQLVQEYPPTRIQQQVQWLPQRKATQNAPGMLRRAIEQGWSAPFDTSHSALSALQSPRLRVTKQNRWFAAEMPNAPRSRREICEKQWFLLPPHVQATLESDARTRFASQQSALAPRLADPNPGPGVRNLLLHYRHELMIERGFATEDSPAPRPSA